MTLFLFWLKIAEKRTAYLIKSRPVVFIGLAVILAAIYIGRNYMKRYMDGQSEIVVLSFFVLVSLLISFRHFQTMPSLMVYAKSGLRNKQIRAWFFVKKALANNLIFPLFFGPLTLLGILITEYPAAIPAAFLLSLLLSFSIMYIKNAYTGKRLNKTAMKKTGFGPSIKSAIIDYFSPDFLQMTVLSIGLFIALAVLLTGNIGFLHELENPSLIFIGILIILSLGFLGIIESVPHINWKFHAIIYPHDFIWHITRAAVFLGVLFCLPILLFIFMSFFFGFTLLLKYLYCTVIMLLLSIHIAFMANGKITKGIMGLLAMVFTAWISTLQAPFLLILAALVLITFFKANNEYRERYYL